MEFKITHYDVVVQYVSHYAMATTWLTIVYSPCLLTIKLHEVPSWHHIYIYNWKHEKHRW